MIRDGAQDEDFENRPDDAVMPYHAVTYSHMDPGLWKCVRL